MTIDRKALAGALATALLLAACGGSASQAPSGAPGASATPAASQPAASDEPTDTAAPTEGAEASLVPGAVGDLEAMLPSEVNGIKFEKSSFDGATIPGGIPIGEGDEDFAKFLSDNGKSLSDVKIAIATTTDTSAGGTVIMAIQVEGVPSDKLLEWVNKDTSSVEKTTVGGKEVYGAAAAGFGAYFYIKDDVVFYVLSMGGADLAEGIFQQLP